MSEEKPSGAAALYKTEDYWAIWLGFAIIVVAMAFFYAGGTIKSIAVTPGKWSSLGQLGADLAEHGLAYAALFVGFGLVFTISMAAMDRDLRQFVGGYTILFVGSLAIFYLAGWKVLTNRVIRNR